MFQKTLKNEITFKGVGLHSGADVSVRILPAEADTGISFLRSDIPGSTKIPATVKNVVATSYATTIGLKGVTVSTIEHLMATFYGLGIDNATVEVHGAEVPVMDGSALNFLSIMEDTGFEDFKNPRKYIVIKEPIKVVEDDKYAYLLPFSNTKSDEEESLKSAEFAIDYTIDFPHPLIDRQNLSILFSRKTFKEDLAGARTFGFLSDVEMLRKNGLAKGGSLENAVVIGETDILNEGGLRFKDEFVRHKVLDAVGDLSLLGAPIAGRLEACRSGHYINYILAKMLLKNPDKWDLAEVSEKEALDSDSGTHRKVAGA